MLVNRNDMPSGLGLVSVMAAPFLLSWLRLTPVQPNSGAASPTQLFEPFPTSSLGEADGVALPPACNFCIEHIGSMQLLHATALSSLFLPGRSIRSLR